MSTFEPNLVLDGYAFFMEVELGEWSRFSRGFRARDEEGNFYILELVQKKRRGMDLLLEINHKTILNCLDIKQTEDGRWIQIFEYFPGETLRELLNGGESFSYLDIAIICFQICNGLSAIHSLELIHEDFRPENIIINSQGEVKLKGVLIPEVLINYLNIPEIWNYVAPEQMTKSVWVRPGPNSNAYSLGAIIYELLTGKRYGKAVSEMEQIVSTSTDSHRALRSQIESFRLPDLPDGLPEEFASIILNSLISDGDSRMSLKDISDVLATFINKSLAEDSDAASEETSETDGAYILSEAEMSVPSEEPHGEEELPVPSEEPSVEEDVPVPAEEPSVEEDVPVPAEEPSVEEDLPVPSETASVEEDLPVPSETASVEEEAEYAVPPPSSGETPLIVESEEALIPEEEENSSAPAIEEVFPSESSSAGAEEKSVFHTFSSVKEEAYSSANMAAEEKLKGEEDFSKSSFSGSDHETRELSQDEMLKGLREAKDEIVKKEEELRLSSSETLEKQPFSSSEEDKISQAEVNYEEDEGPDVKEFIPSVSGGFFSGEVFEKTDYASDGELTVEHPFRAAAINDLSSDYEEEPSSGENDVENIARKVDLLSDEIRTFEKRTSDFMDKLSLVFQDEAPYLERADILNEIIKIKNGLGGLFSGLDICLDFYSGELSFGKILALTSCRQNNGSDNKNNPIIEELKAINETIEKSCEFLHSCEGQLSKEKKTFYKSGDRVEEFLSSLLNFLEGEYEFLALSFKKNSDLGAIISEKEDFLKAVESMKCFLPPGNIKVIQEINVYLERITFVCELSSFYSCLKKQRVDMVREFLNKNIDFLSLEIFCPAEFDYDFLPESEPKDKYDLYQSFPDEIRLRLKETMEKEFGIFPVSVNTGEEYFDFDRHNIVGKVAAPGKEANYKISEEVASGCMYENKVLKKADVKVYIYNG